MKQLDFETAEGRLGSCLWHGTGIRGPEVTGEMIGWRRIGASRNMLWALAAVYDLCDRC